MFLNNNYLATMEETTTSSQSPPGSEVCAGCQETIDDRFLLKVMGCAWHESCLLCVECGAPLMTSCYVREGKFYCKRDYEGAYGTKCQVCDLIIASHEVVMRAGGFVFHLACFRCSICSDKLQKGDEFVLHNSQPLCKQDFDNLENCSIKVEETSSDTEIFDSKENDGYSFEDQKGEGAEFKAEDGTVCDGGSGKSLVGTSSKQTNRKRVILTTQQRRTFRASFDISQKPCRKVKERLARDTGLPVRIVQVWFQNERAKVKKMARRQAQEQDGTRRVGGRGSRTLRGETFMEEDMYNERLLGGPPLPGDHPVMLDHYGNPFLHAIPPQMIGSVYNTSFPGNLDEYAVPEQHVVFHPTELLSDEQSKGSSPGDHTDNNLMLDPQITSIDKLSSMQASYF